MVTDVLSFVKYFFMFEDILPKKILSKNVNFFVDFSIFLWDTQIISFAQEGKILWHNI